MFICPAAENSFFSISKQICTVGDRSSKPVKDTIFFHTTKKKCLLLPKNGEKQKAHHFYLLKKTIKNVRQKPT
jgi:hypothetical protein